MDACEAKEELYSNTAAVDTLKPPLVPAEKNNGATTRRSRTREIGSRYMSPAPATPSASRRSQSPKLSRTCNSSSQSTPKRAISAERRRPSTPPSPIRPSTPVQGSSPELQLSSRKIASGGRSPESLWPSTMHSLSVSFQSDAISIPVSKKEKPVSHALSDRTLKPSSNVAQKQAETPADPRKPTPERKRSPLKGKNSSDQSENSRPVDALQGRLIDQHRWPSRASGRLSSTLLTRSVDLTDKAGKGSGDSISITGKSSSRRLSSEGIPRPSEKSTSDAARHSFIDETGKIELDLISIDNTFQRLSGVHKLSSSSSSERTTVVTPAVRSRSLPGSRFPSPSRPVSRGMASPSRTSPSTPSRGISPSRIRPSSPIRHSNNNTPSVLSFIADIKNGKRGANQLENAHQLRLLYNRYLQWRFANARADAALFAQIVTVEKILYRVWRTTLSLWDFVITKRIDLQKLQLELKLNLVLNEQLAYLEDWDLLERDHSTCLAGVIKDLEASTLRLPVTGGAKADEESLKVAISSAVDVMQTIESSICSVFTKVEGMNCLVSRLAEQAAQERSMLDEHEALLASMAAMQVQEYSLRTQLIQSQQDLRNKRQPLWAI
ncbi:hypothetical protein Nepgr_025130 [Nepenthes gracilis]|uniref:AUGMIN subunit 8 n=1 Tax=Nepenthes gracilis TaxID=150966 RepID=A0AAD3T5W8_NEPGR|nr:hypothetical protein Nepgr_025130 [Nepenthes gracilis]